MLRTLSLFAALCTCLAAQAASSSFNGTTAEVRIAEIGITGSPTRFRDVVLRLTGPSQVYINDPRVTTFSYDEASGALHLPSLVFEGQAFQGVRVARARSMPARISASAFFSAVMTKFSSMSLNFLDDLFCQLLARA